MTAALACLNSVAVPPAYRFLVFFFLFPLIGWAGLCNSDSASVNASD